MSAHEPRRLPVETLQGPADGRSVILVHGFTQNTRCWSPFDRELAPWGTVRALDLPGHGRAGEATDDLWGTGRQVAATAGASAHVGYSLGGRVLLHAALSAPPVVERLVLIGVHPGIEDAGARSRRRLQDEERADHLEAVGTAAFLEEWLALPLFDGLEEGRTHRAQRLANDAPALAGALRRLGTGTQDPLWERLDGLTMPVLVLAGERDARYRELGERTAEAIGPTATAAVVPDVGHAAHLEDPGATARIVLDWLAAPGRD